MTATFATQDKKSSEIHADDRSPKIFRTSMGSLFNSPRRMPPARVIAKRNRNEAHATKKLCAPDRAALCILRHETQKTVRVNGGLAKAINPRATYWKLSCRSFLSRSSSTLTNVLMSIGWARRSSGVPSGK